MNNNKKLIFSSFNRSSNIHKAKALNNEVIDFLNKERIRNREIYTKKEDDLIVYTIELLKNFNTKI